MLKVLLTNYLRLTEKNTTPILQELAEGAWGKRACFSQILRQLNK